MKKLLQSEFLLNELCPDDLTDMVEGRWIDLLVEQFEVELIVIFGVKEEDFFAVEAVEEFIEVDPDILFAEEFGIVENIGDVLSEERSEDEVDFSFFLYSDGVSDEWAFLTVAFELGSDIAVQIFVVGFEELEFFSDVVGDFFEVSGDDVFFPEFEFELVFLGLDVVSREYIEFG